MKKILTFLISVVYLITSFIIIKYFKINELNNITYKNTVEILVTDWQKDDNVEKKLEYIEQFAITQNTNIYKLVFKPKIESEKQKIIIYSAIGNKIDFENKFKLDESIEFKNNYYTEDFISTEVTNDINQIGILDLFTQDYLIEVRPFSFAKQENIRGTYLIQSNDLNKIENIKSEFKALGFDINSSESNKISEEIIDIVNKEVVITLGILLILILLCLLYYVLLRYKELSIKKLFGYSNKNLIFKQLISDIFKICLTSLSAVILILLIYIYKYNKLSNLLSLSNIWILVQLITTLIVILLSIFPILMIYFIDIVQMLKNRKPIGLMQILNYGSRIIFSTCLLVILMNVFLSYKSLLIQNPNKEKWKSTKNYTFYEYSYELSQDTIQKTEYELGIKSQQLFKLNNSEGALLINPSDKIIAESNSVIINENDYYPDNGNSIIINSNYLKENPIYDIYNKRVDVNNEYGDYLIILVPIKYKNDEKEILDIYKKWYQFKRYIDEDINNEKNGIEKIEHPEVKVELIYIQDNQKTFLYNPTLEKENNNYSVNSILLIANSENMGGDSYLSYMTGGFFFPKVTNINNPYIELTEDISKTDLQDTIISTPLLYSKIDKYLFDLQQKINANIFLALLLLLVEIIILTFIVLNYLERNKIVNSLKMIHGYSFFKRHYKFISIVSLTFIPMTIIGILLNTQYLKNILTFIMLYIILSFIFIILLIKVLENKKARNVLKGE